MTPTFTKAIRYFATVTCLAPLRTGSSERDPGNILRGWDGTPFVQGTSLAGALRSWRDEEKLFGKPSKQSELIISDLVLRDNEPVLRPRLRINGKTGTAAAGAKFDVAALPAGTTGAFQITWRGNEDPMAMAACIEEYLTALHSGEITLGALSANGFGRVSLAVRRRIYDLMDPADLEAWLQGDDVGDTEELVLDSNPERDVVFQVRAKVPNILVKSTAGGRSEKGGKGKRTGSANAVQMQEQGRMFVPGSSLKGSVRGQIKRICPYVGKTEEDIQRLFGRESFQKTEGIAGVVRFSDGMLEQPQAINTSRIRINRFTGGTMGRGLFTEQSVSAQLRFEIRLPAGQEAGCALVLYALRDLGLYELGSGTAIGRGRFEDLTVDIRSGGSKATMVCGNNTVDLTDPDELVKGWEAVLTGGVCV